MSVLRLIPILACVVCAGCASNHCPPPDGSPGAATRVILAPDDPPLAFATALYFRTNPSDLPHTVDLTLGGTLPGAPLPLHVPLEQAHELSIRILQIYDGKLHDFITLVGPHPSDGSVGTPDRLASAKVVNAEGAVFLSIGWAISLRNRPVTKTGWVSGSADSTVIAARVKSNADPALVRHCIYNLEPSGSPSRVTACLTRDPSVHVELAPGWFVEVAQADTTLTPRPISSDTDARTFRAFLERRVRDAKL